jgi:hypothetical protein
MNGSLSIVKMTRGLRDELESKYDRQITCLRYSCQEPLSAQNPKLRSEMFVSILTSKEDRRLAKIKEATRKAITYRKGLLK